MLRDDTYTGDPLLDAAPSEPQASPTRNIQVNDLDDVFDSSETTPASISHTGGDAEPHHQPLHSSEPSDVPRLRSIHVTNGYRDGVAEGKAKTVQEGFDEGYSLGAALGLRVGWIIGVLEGCAQALRSVQVRSMAADYQENPTSRRLDAESTSNDEEQSLQESRVTRMVRLAQDARDKLRAERLFGEDFFDRQGLWIYDVARHESEVTFDVVADSHPEIGKWKLVALGEAAGLGFGLGDKVTEPAVGERSQLD